MTIESLKGGSVPGFYPFELVATRAILDRGLEAGNAVETTLVRAMNKTKRPSFISPEAPHPVHLTSLIASFPPPTIMELFLDLDIHFDRYTCKETIENLHYPPPGSSKP
jgi:hypothetical protein